MKKIRDFWKKNTFNKVIAIVIVFTIIGMFIEIFSPNEVKKSDKKYFYDESILNTCDGINVIDNCRLDGVIYEIYVYHPAQEEKSHI